MFPRHSLSKASTRLGFTACLLSAASCPGGGAEGTTPAEPAPNPFVAECDKPQTGWIWCDDFERDRRSAYFEYDSAGGRFRRTADVGFRGGWAMRANWSAGTVAAGALHLALGRTPQPYIRPVDSSTTTHRELFWRLYLRTEPGWVGGGGYKLSRVQILATPQWAQAMIAPVWSGAGAARQHLMIDPFSGTDVSGTLRTTSYGDGANLRPLGAVQSQTALFAPGEVGKWLCVEARVRLNDPGRTNGVFDLWVNGRQEATRSGLNWIGSYPHYGLNAVFVENYWNGGSPQAQARVIDQFIVSTARIGCLP